MTERLGLWIKRAEQTMIAAKEHALRPLGLTVPQYAAMVVLLELPGASGAELARRCLVTPQTMATVLANLESKGLVERQPHPYHRKLHEIRLTPAGRRLVDKADRAALAVEARLAAGLSEQDQKTLRELLDRCVDNLSGSD
ncbi:MarR family winged helix-turn-helix transcriptional regulator [Goodfellowiella coeruleoviolacea]|uniref:DNA-binding transcriptional regulator, MarR family n=1 Tax=Goodfellowiella coeruleoviolacea TaxID=334858 RepID=A0AAE3KH94_9PSEU|nr:MarR family transcriptional regulator [Goodfellowiella coeruleoviolacea]MCP2168066.1 DNA-binding transcriptional regulator, MarR family [Goodfellowiella coeruleoviolacea]